MRLTWVGKIAWTFNGSMAVLGCYYAAELATSYIISTGVLG